MKEGTCEEDRTSGREREEDRVRRRAIRFEGYTHECIYNVDVRRVDSTNILKALRSVSREGEGVEQNVADPVTPRL